MDIEQARAIIAAYLVGKQVPFDEMEEARHVAAADPNYVRFLEEAFTPRAAPAVPAAPARHAAAEPPPAAAKAAVSWLPLVKAACGVELDGNRLEEIGRGFQVLFGMPWAGLPKPSFRGVPSQPPIENVVVVEKELEAGRVRLSVTRAAENLEVQVSSVDVPGVEYIRVELRDAVTTHLLQGTLLNKECVTSQPYTVPPDTSGIHVDVVWPGGSHRVEITLREEGG